MTRTAALPLAVLAAFAMTARADEPKAKTKVTFSGGHDVGKEDFGRPVNLIAPALGVKPQVFREAFGGVTPARGRGPGGAEAQKNKAALLRVLGPHGVTNERLDEVSDYYRFRPQDGELWPTAPAKGYAVVVNGVLKEVVVTDPGSGCNTPPEVTVEGIGGAFKTKLRFGTDLKKNGGVEAVEVGAGECPLSSWCRR